MNALEQVEARILAGPDCPAKTFILAQQKRRRGEAEKQEQAKSVVVSRNMEPWQCNNGHRFTFVDVDRRRSRIGCCPKCTEVNSEISKVVPGTVSVSAFDMLKPDPKRELVERLAQPVVSTGFGPRPFDPENDPELQVNDKPRCREPGEEG